MNSARYGWGIVLSPAVGAVLMSASTVITAGVAQEPGQSRLDEDELAGLRESARVVRESIEQLDVSST